MSTKITEKVVVNAPAGDIVFDGVDFTLNGYIEVVAANSVTLKNCRVYNLNTPNAKNYFLKVIGDIPMVLVIENCFFGPQNVSGNSLYNLIEPNAELKTGSSMSKNFLKKTAASHNSFNIYGVEDGALIKMNDNVLPGFTPGFRIGVKGDKACTIEIKNNTIVAFDEATDGTDPNWYALCCVQPYSTKTVSMAKAVINASGNHLPENATNVVYGYSGAKDTMLDETTAPVYNLDGTATPLTIYH